MANFVFDIAKGRVAELYNRVDTNDTKTGDTAGANALIIVILRTANLEADATLMQRTTLSDIIVTGTSREVGNTGYGRKTLTDTEIAAMAPVLGSSNWMALFLPNPGTITWTGIGAGDGWSKLLFCYDNDTTLGTDANIIPLTSHDFAVTPDGSDIIAQTDITAGTGGWYRAT